MSESIRYRDWLPQQAPGWLQRTNGQAWFWAHGDTLDSLEDAARTALLARFPGHTTEDGLALIGAERGLERIAGESAESFAARITAAWSTWQNAGTPVGLLSALAVAGVGNAIVCPENGRAYSLGEDGELVVDERAALPWVMRGEPFWNEFEVIIPAQGGPWTDSETGIASPPEDVKPLFLPVGTTWDRTDYARIQLIKRLIRKWKGAHCRCAGIVAVTGQGRLVDYPERGLEEMWAAEEVPASAVTAESPWERVELNGRDVWKCTAPGLNADAGLTFTTSAAATQIAFQAKTSTELGYDRLVLRVDGVAVESFAVGEDDDAPPFGRSGLNDWFQFSLSFEQPGAHTVELAYVTDGSESDNDDTVWVADLAEVRDEIFDETIFGLLLEDAGPNVDAVVAVVRSIQAPAWNMAESYVKNAPQVIKSNLRDESTAARYVSRLLAAGAKARFVEDVGRGTQTRAVWLMAAQ